MPSPDNRSAGSGAARRSPPRSCGCAAPERAWSSASRCPSTAAIPPADTSTVMTTSHLVTPGVVIYNAAVIASDNVLEVDADYVLSTYTVDVVGAISAAQVFTPAMREAKAGTFLASGGVAAVDPHPPYASRALGKGGLPPQRPCCTGSSRPRGCTSPASRSTARSRRTPPLPRSSSPSATGSCTPNPPPTGTPRHSSTNHNRARNRPPPSNDPS